VRNPTTGDDNAHAAALVGSRLLVAGQASVSGGAVAAAWRIEGMTP
jgi:hypothetical protein